VLLPAFVCDTVSTPLRKAGARLVLFNMLRDGSIDWDHVESRLDKNVRALLVYHYLGVPDRFEEAVAFGRKHGLFLIEDCAHALFSRWNGRDVGNTGDIAVFSIRKTLPVNYSAALIINNRRIRLPWIRPLSPGPALLNHLLDTENHHYRLYLQSLNPGREVSRETFMQRLHYMDPFYADPAKLYPVDDLSRLVALNADPDAIREKRRRNFSVYLRHLKEIAFFKTLPVGACPLAFPFWVEKGRDALKLRLEKEGIEPARYWPENLLPGGAYRNFPDAAYLADRLLTLPCHPGLGEAEIRHACRALRRLW
jgi:dTDP-4-amino-4,6-dideoxygalactose transaminase